MIVVSGCPRSGTSLTMELMRIALGDARIRGAKFPREARSIVRAAIDTDETFEYRKYLDSVLHPDAEEALAQSKDMNPNGFWECPFTMKGVSYKPALESVLKEVELEESPSVCKIVSQGLAQSDPRYIDKVIYLLRKPSAVAKSQERLRREFEYRTKDGKKYNFFDGMQIISPQVFIEVTLSAARWLEAHPEVPFHFLRYEDLISKPVETLGLLRQFLGEGDFDKAACAIDTSLNRSSVAEVDHVLMPEASSVYEMMENMDWAGLRSYAGDGTRMLNRMNRKWHCARNEMVTQEAHCLNCHANKSFRDQLKNVAVVNGIGWESRPCSFECAHDSMRENFLSVDDSIANNHWKD